MNLRFSDSRVIESAYIIRLSNNPVSVELSDRCKQSCDDVVMHSEFWEGFDGTSGNNIVVPEHLKSKDYFNWLKVHDDKITTSQVAALLSHFSLWCHCLTIDKPIVILEHDAVMIKKLDFFNFYNCIQYLGNVELLNGAPQYIIPPHGTAYGERLKFICRAHAYAVDPQVCKHLISRLIMNGIFVSTTADMFLRADIFNIVQHGLYAYDAADWDRSTIEEKEEY
jgi:hypothetical protein